MGFEAIVMLVVGAVGVLVDVSFILYREEWAALNARNLEARLGKLLPASARSPRRRP